MEIYRFFGCNYHVNVNSIFNYGPGVILSFSVYTFTLLKLFLNEKWHFPYSLDKETEAHVD